MIWSSQLSKLGQWAESGQQKRAKHKEILAFGQGSTGGDQFFHRWGPIFLPPVVRQCLEHIWRGWATPWLPWLGETKVSSNQLSVRRAIGKLIRSESSGIRLQLGTCDKIGPLPPVAWVLKNHCPIYIYIYMWGEPFPPIW